MIYVLCPTHAVSASGVVVLSLNFQLSIDIPSRLISYQSEHCMYLCHKFKFLLCIFLLLSCFMCQGFNIRY
jgi:hypothetical protein